MEVAATDSLSYLSFGNYVDGWCRESFLRKNKKAAAFFKTLNKANVYAIVYRLETAKKPETREKRMKTILAMLEQGKAFHP